MIEYGEAVQSPYLRSGDRRTIIRENETVIEDGIEIIIPNTRKEKNKVAKVFKMFFVEDKSIKDIAIETGLEGIEVYRILRDPAIEIVKNSN